MDSRRFLLPAAVLRLRIPHAVLDAGQQEGQPFAEMTEDDR
jgi:hypothetical protein